LLASIQNQTGMKRIWIYREMRKNNKRQFMNVQHFDQVIIPTEAGSSMTGNHSAIISYCKPIIYLDKSELIPKEEIRRLWRITDHSKLVYVQLGSGQLNDVQSLLSMLRNILKEREDLFMVVGEHVLGEGIKVTDDRMMVLRDYPNSKYFHAFDLAISAAGYNTYHELMYFQVPTIFIPNEKSTTDDQLSRANNAQKHGAALVLQDPTEEELRAAMDVTLDKTVNEQMRLSAQTLVCDTGALQAAKWILGD
jgi:UDP-N-acetylglucosamine--N-acetylmuramyl-(pentapeptide) pyrophosphoryl-undecaprenol N-acetylglucosamine transferase